MTPQLNSRRRRISTIMLGVAFVVTSCALGALLGGAYVRFVLPKAVDGWTGIAQALGGLMGGGALGLMVSLALATPLARRGPASLGRAALLALAGAVAVLLVLLLLRRPAMTAPAESPEVPPVTAPRSSAMIIGFAGR